MASATQDPGEACLPLPARWRGTAARSWLLAVLWLGACLVAIVVLWVATFEHIEGGRMEAIARATQEARTSAAAYQGYLERSIEHSDQLLQVVRYRWSHGGVSLEALRENGAFAGQDGLGATILDASGDCVSASLGCTPNQSFEYREYFRFHRDHPEDVAHLGPAVGAVNGRASRRTLVHLSRRLVDASGRFDGVVVLPLEEPYFTEFFRGSRPAEPDIVGLIGSDGNARALRIGANDISTGSYPIAGPRAVSGTSGAARLAGGEWSLSPEASLVAWKALEHYPLIALVGLSEDRVLASWAAARETALRAALFWTLVLLGLGWAASVMILRVVSRRVREERVRAAYRVATEGTRDGLSFLEPRHDAARRIIDLTFADCNEAAASMLGMTRAQLVGRRCSELLAPAELEPALRLFEEAAAQGRLESVRSGCALGPLVMGMLWVEHRIVRTGLGFAVTLRDVTEAVVHREQLEQMANEDRLTGLPNRNWLETEVARLIQPGTAPRASREFALLFVDFDGFKRVNDSMGHSAGDLLLREAARRLGDALAEGDSVVRLGGDEFVVLVTSGTTEEALAELAGRLVRDFGVPFDLPDGEIRIGVSIGICLYPQHGQTTEELLRNADIAMYEEKARRRGRFSFFRPELFSAVKQRFEMEAAIRNALDRDEFVLHFQPQFAIETGALVGFEALLRWLRPGVGIVLPGDFVAVAEEAGLITRLGEQVIEKACQQLASWRALQLPAVPVSVNVSAIQLRQSDIRQTFERALTRYRIPAGLLQMEITESSMIGPEVGELLQHIRHLGIRISVDDFGTGYSSLSQLQQLRVDAIKIDRSFISKMQDSSEGEVFVRAIISMAHALAVKVVAEGVETPVQLECLKRLQCEAGQGYLFSKALAAALATDLLARQAVEPLGTGVRPEARPAGYGRTASEII